MPSALSQFKFHISVSVSAKQVSGDKWAEETRIRNHHRQKVTLENLHKSEPCISLYVVVFSRESVMKKRLLVLFLLSFVILSALMSQSTTAGAVNGMTLNGATGLIIVPDARIGWENTKFGLDIGYGFVWGGQGNLDNLPRFSFSLFQKAEIYGLVQFGSNGVGMKNFVVGGKFQLFKDGGAAMALGGDFEFLNNNFSMAGNSGKVYLAMTYGGNFFKMPAVTTATIGWQFLNRSDFSSQFVYGMGFSMTLFPNTFKDFVYWITDFSNFSYVVTGSGINANSRGAFNTGVRIHPFKGGKFNMIIDVVGADLLDDGQRALVISISGGFGF